MSDDPLIFSDAEISLDGVPLNAETVTFESTGPYVFPDPATLEEAVRPIRWSEFSLSFTFTFHWRPPRLSRAQVVDMLVAHARAHGIGCVG